MFLSGNHGSRFARSQRGKAKRNSCGHWVSSRPKPATSWEQKTHHPKPWQDTLFPCPKNLGAGASDSYVEILKSPISSVLEQSRIAWLWRLRWRDVCEQQDCRSEQTELTPQGLSRNVPTSDNARVPFTAAAYPTRCCIKAFVTEIKRPESQLPVATPIVARKWRRGPGLFSP
jgi:hypothetical protein